MLSSVISTQSQYILLSKIFIPVWFLQHWLYFPYWAIYTQLTSISLQFLKTEVTRKPHQRNFDIIENISLLSISFIHPFNKYAFYVWGSIFGTVRQINSWKAWSLHNRVYNYIREKNSQNIYKRQCQVSVIKWYMLSLKKVQRKE